MSSSMAAKAVLMSAEIRESGNGFHRLRFKVEGGRNRMTDVTVLISQDAHRKLISQLGRSHVNAFERGALLKAWSRWEIGQRIAELGVAPANITITASDLDEFGAYASALASSMQA